MKKIRQMYPCSIRLRRTSLFLLFAVLTLTGLFSAVPARAAVKLSRSAISVAKGKTTTLKVSGTTKTVKWSSSNKAIATVTQKGVVKGVKKGKAVIKAVVGSKTYKCTVTVSAARGRTATVKKSDVSKVTYKTYKEANNYFSMKIPNGWKVKVGIKASDEYSLINYGISVYDPKNLDRELYLCLMVNAGLQSEAAHNWWVSNYPSSAFAKLPYLNEISTRGYFQTWQKYYRIKNFKVQKNLGKSSLGGDILLATGQSAATGKQVKGLFTAVIEGNSLISTYPANAYIIIMEKAPEEEFLDWQPVLDKCFSTLKFTSKFISARNDEWKNTMGSVAAAVQNGREMSDMIMDSYDKRSKSSDVLSQKRSDATLGYERVYDTETKEYYKADLGFGDYYTGSRYKTVTSNKAYLAPVSGYITWK